MDRFRGAECWHSGGVDAVRSRRRWGGRRLTGGAVKAAAERALGDGHGGSAGRTVGLAFSHFAVGRLYGRQRSGAGLSMPSTRAASIYARLPGGELQLAHVDMQLAVHGAGGRTARRRPMRLADRAIPVVRKP